MGLVSEKEFLKLRTAVRLCPAMCRERDSAITRRVHSAPGRSSLEFRGPGSVVSAPGRHEGRVRMPPPGGLALSFVGSGKESLVG